MQRLILFWPFFDIFDDESVNLIFRNKKKGGTQMTDRKSNLNINLGEIRYLEVPDIIN